MTLVRWRRRRLSSECLLMASAVLLAATCLLLFLTLWSFDPSLPSSSTPDFDAISSDDRELVAYEVSERKIRNSSRSSVTSAGKCATVEQMGEIFGAGSWEQESLRVRSLIEHHFAINGPTRVRDLPPELFCRHGFVIGKASEAGFGNEMYKMLTAAALSIMLNRSLIIGQTRGKYPFGDYITYSNISFTLKEVKHLWRRNGCATKYGRLLTMRVDDFQKPTHTSVLCGNWMAWKQPIIWLQNAMDAVAAQFFLKNVHAEMRAAALDLFGSTKNLQFRPNVFGELLRALISPSENIKEAVNWAIKGGPDPDIALHMRMLMNRSVRALQSALLCIRKAIQHHQLPSRPRVVLVSDTPSMVKDIALNIDASTEVLHFDYEHFEANMSGKLKGLHDLDFRTRDWGPAPRWVAFVDFFLASRARYAVVSGAHRRVGTTYAQLMAARAAANRLDNNSSGGSTFSFFSSFQRNLVASGLKSQVGWGHVWNRFAGPLSCHGQSNQCALTPLLPPGWWDDLWQSPIPRDIHRMEAYGVKLSGFGTLDEDYLRQFCMKRKNTAVKVSF